MIFSHFKRENKYTFFFHECRKETKKVFTKQHILLHRVVLHTVVVVFTD